MRKPLRDLAAQAGGRVHERMPKRLVAKFGMGEAGRGTAKESVRKGADRLEFHCPVELGADIVERKQLFREQKHVGVTSLS
ncbi:MAG TPA: hypothetical protein VEX11_05380 [Acetobacteraceae bacterium]|nr:hypothetical protein [Acetobacteraceae bacterium]